MPRNKKRMDKKTRKKKKEGYLPGLSRALGGTIGNYFAGPVGAELGRRAGDWLGHVSGFGDYKIEYNTILANNSPPLFGGGNSTVITHREFIADIKSTEDFTIRKFALNPGDPDTFPWAHSVALNYEQYELLGAIVEFKTLSGTAVGSTNTALGSVIMATNYNALAAAPTTKRAMEAHQFCVSTVPCRNAIHPI